MTQRPRVIACQTILALANPSSFLFIDRWIICIRTSNLAEFPVFHSCMLGAAYDSGGWCWWNHPIYQSFSMEWCDPCWLRYAIFPIYCWGIPRTCIQGNLLISSFCRIRALLMFSIESDWTVSRYRNWKAELQLLERHCFGHLSCFF